jgi:type I restriction enzyme M protein
MHNSKETAFFRLVPGAPGERIQITNIPAAAELGDDRRLDEIRRATKAFTRDEFQRLLFECHSILRDNHKLDPGAAFDEISKILFIKMAFERMDRAEVFTTERLAAIARANLIADADDPSVLTTLFETTKRHYKADQLFGAGEALRVSMPTFRRIVKLLERFNLSDTGDDVKGIAFERFLGQTFRGELGQFFTPRPIVDFAIQMLDPQEDELICDPASGTGGFLIRAFEHVRSAIEGDIQAKKDEARRLLESRAAAEGWHEDRLTSELEAQFTNLNRDLDLSLPASRLFRVSHERIFGIDAEPRAARTSKMNMIMHGDGHGGIHYHDGLLDTNGIFPGRFNIVVTNPPFGSSVGNDQVVGATEQTRIDDDPERIAELRTRYGASWDERHAALLEAQRARVPILQLFDIGRSPIGGPAASSQVRPSRSTETLFVERCIQLLRPGGRMAIVLPDGVLNNPSLGWLREYVRGRARLVAVVSLPQEVFASSKATVKTSLVFLTRFTDAETHRYQQIRVEVEAAYAERRVAAVSKAERQALRAESEAGVERRFAYPVFLAEASAAGITATGDTGPDVPNELPAILAEYHRYRGEALAAYANDPDAYAAAAAATRALDQATEPPAPEMTPEVDGNGVQPSAS